MYLEPPEQMVGFLFPRTVSGRFLAEGANLSNERLLVLPPGSGADIVVPALVGKVGLRKLYKFIKTTM